MKKNFLIYIIITFILISCGVKKTVFSKITDQSKRTRYVTEIDDPATRGKISRISPELTNINGYIDISSDGRYLFFSGDLYAGSSNKEIWKLDLQGETLPIRLTAGEGKHKNLDSWMPTLTNDDAYVMYKSGTGIWMIKTDGTGGRIKFPGSGYKEDHWPKISSDNKVAFFTMTDGKNIIWLSDLDGKNLKYLREGATPDWSPDGKSLVFIYSDDIWTINMDGSMLTQITNTPLIEERSPTYSSDGKKIYFTSNQDKNKQFFASNDLESSSLEKIFSNLRSRNFNIWSIELNGSSLTQITELDSWDTYPYSASDGLYFLSGRGNDATILGADKVRVWKISN